MSSKKYYYNDFNGKKVEYVLEKGLSLSQKMSFVVEVAGTVVSKEVGYAQVLRQPMFEYCLITYTPILFCLKMGKSLVWIRWINSLRITRKMLLMLFVRIHLMMREQSLTMLVLKLLNTESCITMI